MKKIISEKLRKEGFVSQEMFEAIQKFYAQKLFSLHWEIKTFLYLGVLLLSTGAALFIYQHIDSIGSQAILAFLAVSCAACFVYCFKTGAAYQPDYAESPGLLFDYLLLLGCLLFLAFEGYFQYTYSIFGTRYGLASLVPALLFFFLAYRFDHKGVLSMGITGLTAWLGFSVTPRDIITGELRFEETNMIWIAITFGISLGASALLLERYNIKKHFTFTYLNFAANVLFAATLCGLFTEADPLKMVFFIFLLGCCTAFILYSRREQSFYFLLISAVYGYIGITFLLFHAFSFILSGDEGLYLAIFYFIASCGLLIYFFIHHKRILKI